MDVSSTIFQPIFEGVKQYVVPLFQRSYSWGKKEWMTLWTDIKELYDSDNSSKVCAGRCCKVFIDRWTTENYNIIFNFNGNG